MRAIRNQFPLVVSGVLMAMTVALSPACADDERLRLVVGSSAIVALTENPSTGYRWRINATASTNISLVAISDVGFSAGDARLLGTPGTRRFRIAARRSGTAVAVFDYARPWEHVAASRHHVVTIQITGR